MERITMKNLENRVLYINETFGLNYHIDGAYNGWRLESERCSDVLYCGYTTKGRLYDLMGAFIEGLKVGKK